MQMVCSAAENADIPLRRSEKKVLNILNKKAFDRETDCPGSTFAVHEGRESKKIKQRIQEPWEKSFILVRESIASSNEVCHSIAPMVFVAVEPLCYS
jgi:hypothetical protein